METRLIPEREIKISLFVSPEYESIHGNASAIDEETDRETEEWIENELRNGNEWAWCQIEVRAEWNDLSASDYLGCCSYRSMEDFKQPGGYYDDMRNEAISLLNDKAQSIISELCHD